MVRAMVSLVLLLVVSTAVVTAVAVLLLVLVAGAAALLLAAGFLLMAGWLNGRLRDRACPQPIALADHIAELEHELLEGPLGHEACRWCCMELAYSNNGIPR